MGRDKWKRKISKKLRSTFHDYLNFCGDKKDDGLFTIYF